MRGRRLVLAPAEKAEELLGGDGALAYRFTLFHSSNYARLNNAQPSALYLPDKVSILHEPRWWYLLRARLSGEVFEYIENSPFAHLPPSMKTPGNWYCWYKRKVKEKLCGCADKVEQRNVQHCRAEL